MSHGFQKSKRIKQSRVRGAGKLLATDLQPQHIQCKPKQPYTLNSAIKTSSEMQEEYGDFLLVSTIACGVLNTISAIVRPGRYARNNFVSGVVR